MNRYREPPSEPPGTTPSGSDKGGGSTGGPYEGPGTTPADLDLEVVPNDRNHPQTEMPL